MRYLNYILKTLWRHRSRTLLTVSGSAVALFVFCFVGAVQEGMNNLRHQKEAEQSLIIFQANKFCPATSHLPQDYDEKLLDLDGVRDAVPIQVFTNNCRASLDVVVFYGIPPEKLQKVRDFKLIEGSWGDFVNNQDSAVIGKAVANRRGLHAGEKFKIGDLIVDIAGVFTSGNPAEENYIYSHLDYLQRRNGANLVGTVTQLEVLLEEGVDPTEKSAQIDQLFKGGPIETDTRAKGAFQARSLSDLTQLIELSHYLGLACVGLVLALVATTTLMSVQDRVKEYAVLQTLGFTGGKIFGLVLSESLVLSVAGGILGVGISMLMLNFGSLAVGAEAVTIAFRPSWSLAILGMGVAAVSGLLAGVAPAWQASRIEIVPALRQ
ncbi:MAG TPA: ABC transporter permease [Planctomycetaceae bacterium]|nr:ABC transporter permease [Planctomycetaceae bacterium]